LPAPPGQVLDPQRLGDWRTSLAALGLAIDESTPLYWLETGDE